ncbi:MAG TPA: hypothetical protein VJB02_03575 [Coxiellaceae bacterium]|nr:hypothetical protein [Coxiellaceae bacterium]
MTTFTHQAKQMILHGLTKKLRRPIDLISLYFTGSITSPAPIDNSSNGIAALYEQASLLLIRDNELHFQLMAGKRFIPDLFMVEQFLLWLRLHLTDALSLYTSLDLSVLNHRLAALTYRGIGDQSPQSAAIAAIPRGAGAGAGAGAGTGAREEVSAEARTGTVAGESHPGAEIGVALSAAPGETAEIAPGVEADERANPKPGSSFPSLSPRPY